MTVPTNVDEGESKRVFKALKSLNSALKPLVEREELKQMWGDRFQRWNEIVQESKKRMETQNQAVKH